MSARFSCLLCPQDPAEVGSGCFAVPRPRRGAAGSLCVLYVALFLMQRGSKSPRTQALHHCKYGSYGVRTACRVWWRGHLSTEIGYTHFLRAMSGKIYRWKKKSAGGFEQQHSSTFMVLLHMPILWKPFAPAVPHSYPLERLSFRLTGDLRSLLHGCLIQPTSLIAFSSQPL